jgi:hypothetical protein
LRSWLAPTLFGPSVGACLFVLGYAWLGGVGIARSTAELVGSVVVATVVGLALCVVDLGLLVARLRSPPTGSRAWLSSTLAGAVAVLLWRFLRPTLLSAPATHLLAAGAAVLVSAMLVRLLGSERPRAWVRFVSSWN